MAIRPELSGLAETAQWTVWFRAAETRRGDALLSDPLAVEVLEKIDFPFEGRFGRLFPAQALSLALRVLAFDGQVRGGFLPAIPTARSWRWEKDWRHRCSSRLRVCSCTCHRPTSTLSSPGARDDSPAVPWSSTRCRPGSRGW